VFKPEEGLRGRTGELPEEISETIEGYRRVEQKVGYILRSSGILEENNDAKGTASNKVCKAAERQEAHCGPRPLSVRFLDGEKHDPA